MDEAAVNQQGELPDRLSRIVGPDEQTARQSLFLNQLDSGRLSF
jgi:hypothetical protein